MSLTYPETMEKILLGNLIDEISLNNESNNIKSPISFSKFKLLFENSKINETSNLNMNNNNISSKNIFSKKEIFSYLSNQ